MPPSAERDGTRALAQIQGIAHGVGVHKGCERQPQRKVNLGVFWRKLEEKGPNILISTDVMRR